MDERNDDFLFTYITDELKEHLLFPNTFSNFFHNYDVTTLEIIHPITFRKYTKHPIKVKITCSFKGTLMQI